MQVLDYYARKKVKGFRLRDKDWAFLAGVEKLLAVRTAAIFSIVR